METLETSSLTEKVAQKFYCYDCDYSTSRKSNYNKHLLTRKHQKSSNGNTGNTILKKVAEQNPLSLHKKRHHDFNNVPQRLLPLNLRLTLVKYE